ncbi:unnamed protein product [Bursaphelenchus okinawaensis]|uniref:Protein sprint n=1 Tax=Bursaphelenchus okinawaensis TaxID=465554 RepID=A0A811LAB1_9BILA|nr:unnamed protein product [Bursaphelenchus okinawaensis]CAG9120670.1 unnamed protein product [Bursaphelenchus okinawaensis]
MEAARPLPKPRTVFMSARRLVDDQPTANYKNERFEEENNKEVNLNEDNIKESNIKEDLKTDGNKNVQSNVNGGFEIKRPKIISKGSREEERTRNDPSTRHNLVVGGIVPSFRQPVVERTVPRVDQPILNRSAQSVRQPTVDRSVSSFEQPIVGTKVNEKDQHCTSTFFTEANQNELDSQVPDSPACTCESSHLQYFDFSKPSRHSTTTFDIQNSTHGFGSEEKFESKDDHGASTSNENTTTIFQSPTTFFHSLSDTEQRQNANIDPNQSLGNKTVDVQPVRAVQCVQSLPPNDISANDQLRDRRMSKSLKLEDVIAASNEERPKFNLESLVAPVLLDQNNVQKENLQGLRMSIPLQTEQNQLLWQKIIYSHPIWYLQGQSRHTVSHLLQVMQPGNFIVRSSSRADSMALSIKVSPTQVRHYLIEKYKNGVRLEKSVKVFKSLPFLIQYYCQNSDGIVTCLRLPEEILQCDSLMCLQKLALLGPDFWSRQMSRPHRPPSYCSTQNGDQFSVRSLQMSKSMCGSAQEFDARQLDSPPTRRRSTLRLGTATVQDYSTEMKPEKSRIQMGTACSGNANQLRKSYSAFSGISMADSPQTRKRMEKGQKLRKPTKFFKNLFSSNTNINNNYDPKDGYTVQSDYFVPGIKRTVSSSQSEASLWSSSDWTPNCDQCHRSGRSNDRPVITKTFPSTTSISSVGSSTAASLKKGLTNRLLSFRGQQNSKERVGQQPLTKDRIGQPTAIGVQPACKLVQPAPRPGVIGRKSKDDMCEQMNAIKARKMPLRRGNTDLSAHRLAVYQPSTLTRERSATFVKSSPPTTAVPPMVPPHGRLNAEAMQKCIDEMRMRKIDNNNSFSSSSTYSAKNDSSNEDKPAKSSMNNNNRLSVPNLNENENSDNENIKAPTAKLGRNGNGELQTINEGLITPVVRRKHPQRQFVRIPPNNSELSSTLPRDLPSSASSTSSTSSTHSKDDYSLRDQITAAGDYQRRPYQTSSPRLLNTSQRIQSQSPRSVHQSKASASFGDRSKTFDSDRSKNSEGFGARYQDSESYTGSLKASEGYPTGRSKDLEAYGQGLKDSEGYNQRVGNSELYTGSYKDSQPYQRSKDSEYFTNSPKNSETYSSSYKPANLSPAQASESSTALDISPRSELSSTTNRPDRFTQWRKNQEDASSQTNPVSTNWSAVNEELKSRHNVAKVKPQPVQRTLCKFMDTEAQRPSEYAEIHENFEKKDLEEDDCVSVAGTVFNEPWDSNAWENLLDIVHFYDEKPTKAKAKAVYLECCANETIAEEDDNLSCSAGSAASTCSKTSFPNQTLHSNSDVEVQEVPLSVDDAPDSDDHFEQFDNFKTEPLTINDNRNWTEVSKRIPSEPGTFDSRRGKSSSLMNVNEDYRFMSPLLDTRSMKHRAMTPGMYGQSHLCDSMDELSMTLPSVLPAISPARLRSTDRMPDPGFRIQRYVEQLATDSTTTFGATLQQFIECTIDAGESDPHVVIRNVRQFLNGIKNYLVKNGEADLLQVIEEESSKLNPNEFLNIDAILEAVLHKILLVPIKPHLYHLMCRENIRNGSFETLTANLSKVRTMRPEQLGFPKGTIAPDSKKMEQVRSCLRKMQSHYSPLKKLENLLKALNVVVGPNRSLIRSSKKLPAADELIRWLVFLLARTSSVSCEVEAWYMWELLPQQLLTTGDAAYYLSTLLSAVHVLKNLDSIQRLKFMSNEPNFSTPQSSLRCCIEEASDAYIRVAIPDEQKGSIEYHTFPAVAQMNVARLCRVIAHQLAITNPEDYGLCVLYDGYETCLNANECPDAIRQQLNDTGKPHLFAYKRHDAKIAWPSSAVQLTSTCAKSPSQHSHLI